MKRLACVLFMLTSGAVVAREAPSVPVPASWSLAGGWRAHDGNDATFMGQQGPVRDWRTLPCRQTGIPRAGIIRACSGIAMNLPCRRYRKIRWRRWCLTAWITTPTPG